jgi:hypothetical protein
MHCCCVLCEEHDVQSTSCYGDFISNFWGMEAEYLDREAVIYPLSVSTPTRDPKMETHQLVSHLY